MEISEKVAYLKGLAEGLKLDEETKEGKLIAAIIDVLDAMAEEFADVEDELIDLIIPRGSNAFVRYIMDNSRIPVLGHADGLCHVYVDAAADVDMAVTLTVDSKAQNVSVCNAA